MHKFYVDDHNLAMEELPAGARYRDGVVAIVPEEVEADCLLPGDQRTAQVIKEVANSICMFTRVSQKTFFLNFVSAVEPLVRTSSQSPQKNFSVIDP